MRQNLVKCEQPMDIDLALGLGSVAIARWNLKGVQVSDYIPTSHPKLKETLAKGKPIVLTFQRFGTAMIVPARWTPFPQSKKP